jgi:hypothetical protein
MPVITRLPTTTPVTEPLPLELLRQWIRVDGTAEDMVLEQLRQAAREEAENYTGLFFAGGQRLRYVFTLEEAYSIPEGATVESVSGFFTSLAGLEAWSAEEYRKGISVSRDYPLSQALQQTYTVDVQLPETVAVPSVAVQAMLILAAEWYKNREASVNGTISVETQVKWQNLLGKLRALPAFA